MVPLPPVNNLAEYGRVVPPVGNVMRAGSICFAHGLIIHSGMPNETPGTVRVGMFSRWHHGGEGGDMERYPRYAALNVEILEW